MSNILNMIFFFALSFYFCFVFFYASNLNPHSARKMKRFYVEVDDKFITCKTKLVTFVNIPYVYSNVSMQ